MKKTVIALIIGFVILTALAVLNDNEGSTMLLPQPKEDFTNSDAGTVIMMTTVQNLNVPEGIEYVVFFKSKFIPGLSIQYNLPDLSLEAGIPLMSSETNILGKHLIAYTYEKKGSQNLYFDGNKVASSHFIGRSISPITGNVVLDTTNVQFIEPDAIETYDRILTEEEIKGGVK